MNHQNPSPPRWMESALKSLLRPSDRESISGDLLEEYRDARHPAMGALRAGVWYFKQILSVLWRLIWPFALAMAAMSVVTLAVMRIPGNVSLAQAPRVSLLDAAIYLWAGYHASRRTGLIRSAVLAAGSISFIGFIVTFASFAIGDPSLLMAPFSKPFIFVILSVMLVLALATGIAAGAAGGAIGKRFTPAAPQTTPASS